MQITANSRSACPLLNPRSAYRGRQPLHRAFTLVEVLVVIGIIGLLIGILLPALSAAQQTAKQAKSLSNIRQLSIAYAQYHLDNLGSLPFGYPPAVVDGVATTVQLPSGHVAGFPLASRYPWRLVNYVADVWSMIHAHKDLPPVPLSTDSPADAESKAYSISLSPTYGINAYYVGGHYGFYGFDAVSGHPNPSGPAVFKVNQVRRPTELIVFADATAAGIPGVSADDGWFVVTPPKKRGVQWTVEMNKCIPVSTGVAMGLPQGRYGRGAAVAFFDGHVESRQPDELTDMRLWSAKATSAEWDYTP